MTEEERERVKQIERWRMLYVSANSDPYADLSRAFGEIDFLLSMIDSHAAGNNELDDVKAIRARAYNKVQFSADTYMHDVRRLLHLYPQLNDRVATIMRDACVDAIKTLRATPHGAAYSNAINDAIHKVESLTLDQVEQVQQPVAHRRDCGIPDCFVCYGGKS